MGGTPLLLKPLPMGAADGVFETVCEALGLQNVPAEERVKQLLSKDPSEILAAVPSSLPFMPVIDDDVVLSSPSFATWASLPRGTWCKRLMIGDCELDVS